MAQNTTIIETWTYRDPGLATSLTQQQVLGYDVEALDGSIGKIDEASYDVSSSYVVVDTGPWIFGKKVMLPAGVIDRVDLNEEKVYVHRTKDEIKDAPEFDENSYRDAGYRERLGGYYGPGGTGYREW
jgi:hypothetical protein